MPKKVVKKTSKKEVIKPDHKKLNVYILLDRSGSMSGRWAEALSSINSYVKELAKKSPNAHVSLSVFDGQGGLQFDTVRDAVTAKAWNKVTDEDASPRGLTPLYDAIGQVVALANAADQKKTIIVVMTDGAENNSAEVTKAAATKMLDRCRARDWQVVFLGADFDAFAQASAVGVLRASTVNTTAGNYVGTMSMMAAKSAGYGATGQSVMFSAADRDLAAGKDKKSKFNTKIRG